MEYVDGFVLPVPKKNLKAYKALAKLACKVWLDHGALDYRECVAQDVKPGKLTSFPQSVKLKTGELWCFPESQVAQASRQGDGKGHERPAARSDDGPEENAI